MRKYSEIMKGIRQQISCICGDNNAFSYPMPDIENGMLVEKFFIYPVSFNKERTRPYALAVSLMEDGTLCRYQNCRFEDFVDTEKYPFAKKISYEIDMKRYSSIKEIKLEQNLINKTYEFVRTIAFKDNLTEVQKKVLAKYYVLLEGAVPQYLAPFYAAMGKNFIEWTGKNV